MAWTEALASTAARLSQTDARWMLVGSAGCAVRGVAVVPGDIDILAATAQDVTTLAAAMAPFVAASSPADDPGSFLSTSERPCGEWPGVDEFWRLGRWVVAGTKVEVAYIWLAQQEGALAETYGDRVSGASEVVEWHGFSVPIVPLEVQYVTLLSRSSQSRLDLVEAYLRDRGFDAALIEQSMSDQGILRGRCSLVS